MTIDQKPRYQINLLVNADDRERLQAIKQTAEARGLSGYGNIGILRLGIEAAEKKLKKTLDK